MSPHIANSDFSPYGENAPYNFLMFFCPKDKKKENYYVEVANTLIDMGSLRVLRCYPYRNLNL